MQEELTKDVVVATVVDRELTASISTRVLKQISSRNRKVGFYSDCKCIVWNQVVVVIARVFAEAVDVVAVD